MSKIREFFISISRFLLYDIWRITGQELSKTNRFLYNTIKTIVLAIKGFKNDNLDVKASALTYSLLFAIVPIVALFISIAKGFGVEKAIENVLMDSYIGRMGLIPTVMDFVQKYLLSMREGLFIGIGIVILLWSVISFFMQVENAFNDIWQVKKSRSFAHQFTTYFSTILLIPILIICSSGLSIFVSSATTDLKIFDLISPVVRVLVKLSPFFINWIVFSILYVAIPNTKVKFANALIAGIIAGTAFQIFQILYINGQVYLSRYNAVYGGFAAAPLFFLWMRISCLIILFGAEISYAAQNIKNFEFENDTKTISPRYNNFLMLFITYLIVKQFEKGAPPLSTENIIKRHNLPIRLVNNLLRKLVDANVLIEISNELEKTKSYLPAIDINKLSVGLLYERVDSHGAELFIVNKNQKMELFWQKTLALRSKTIEENNKVLIKDIC